jgi:hypothetical protein
MDIDNLQFDDGVPFDGTPFDDGAGEDSDDSEDSSMASESDEDGYLGFYYDPEDGYVDEADEGLFVEEELGNGEGWYDDQEEGINAKDWDVASVEVFPGAARVLRTG